MEYDCYESSISHSPEEGSGQETMVRKLGVAQNYIMLVL